MFGPSTYYRLLKNYILTGIGMYAPRTAEVAITYSCNLRCSHCSRENLPDESLPFDILTRMFSEFDSKGGAFITFTGGEPMMRKDLLDLIGFLKSNTNVLATMTSNGTLMNEQVIRDLAKQGLHSLNISMYGKEEFHDSFVNKPGSYKKTVRSLELAKQHLPGVALLCVPTRQALADGNFEHIMSIGKDLNIPVRINMPTFSGAFADFDNLLREDEIKRVYNLYDNKSIGSDSLGVYTHNRCPSTHSAFYVAPSGEVTPCPFIHISFGNIMTQSLDDIFKNITSTNYHKIKFAKKICPAAEDHDFIKSVLLPAHTAPRTPVEHTSLSQFESFIKRRLDEQSVK